MSVQTAVKVSGGSSAKSTKTEEYSRSSTSYSTGGVVQEAGQSSRVVYSAPVSVIKHEHNSVGAADNLRTYIKIISEDESALFGEDAAKFILETREREKRELQGLNDRLAAYLEKTRHLELQNKDMDGLRSRWEQDVLVVKKRYEHELAEMERNLEDSAKIKASLEAQIGRLSSDIGDHKRRFDDVSRHRDDQKGRADDLLKKLNETETQLNLLHRSVQGLEDEVGRLRAENARLLAELQKARDDLDAECLKSIQYQNEVQALLKKIEFLKHEHELEVKQFSGQSISVVSTAEYQNELAAAIREIRKEFDDLAKQNKVDLEAWYRRKVHEIQITETGQYQDEAKRLNHELQSYGIRIAEYESTNSKLKRDLADLQQRLEGDKRNYEVQLIRIQEKYQGITNENHSLQLKLKALFDTNQALYAEIAIYRKLLDGEEGRYSTRIQEVVKPVESVHVLKEEMVTHTSYQRSNKGNVQFSEVSPDGRYIVLENLSVNKEENLGHWKLTRQIDGSREVTYTFPSKFTLKAGKTVKIWAKGQHGSASLVDALVFEGADSWGVGLNVTTTLYNRDGEEKANYIQTTTTSQRTLESS